MTSGVHSSVVREVTQIRGHHANDRVSLTAELNGLPDDVRVSGELCAPERLAQHGDAIAARRVFARCDHAAQQGRDAEHFKEFRRNQRRAHSLRRVLALPGCS